jgi:hypothetical protein
METVSDFFPLRFIGFTCCHGLPAESSARRHISTGFHMFLLKQKKRGYARALLDLLRYSLELISAYSAVFFSHNKSASARISQLETIQRTE